MNTTTLKWKAQAIWGPRVSSGAAFVERAFRLRSALAEIEPAYANLAAWLSGEAKPPTPLEQIDPAQWAEHLEDVRAKETTSGYMQVLPVTGLQQEAGLSLVEGIVNDPELLQPGEIADPRRFPNDCLIDTPVDGKVFATAETLSRALEVLIEVCEPVLAAVHINYPRDQARYWLLWTVDGFEGELDQDTGIRVDAEPDRTQAGMGGTLRINSRNAPAA